MILAYNGPPFVLPLYGNFPVISGSFAMRSFMVGPGNKATGTVERSNYSVLH
jgi:hypothetical protein